MEIGFVPSLTILLVHNFEELRLISGKNRITENLLMKYSNIYLQKTSRLSETFTQKKILGVY